MHLKEDHYTFSLVAYEEEKKKKKEPKEEEEEEEEDKKKKKGSPAENKEKGKSGGSKHGAGNMSPTGEDPGDSVEQIN
jgi:hypothetical protein